MEAFANVLFQLGSWVSGGVNTLIDTGRLFQPIFRNISIVMFGGALGAVSRYGVNLISVRLWGSGFPWGTMLVNLVGCFLIGLLFSLADRFRWLTPDMRLFLITGYLGALTTFSSFSIETVNAARAGIGLPVLANILINNAGGFALTFFGLWLGGQK